MRVWIFLLTLSLLLPVAGSSQTLFKWVDDQGVTHYGDNPPGQAQLQQITGQISSFKTVNIEKFQYDPALFTRRNTEGKPVIMYSTSWCGYCKKARQHFRKNRIPFDERDIEKSEMAAREYKKLNGRGVPVILVGKQRMNGFSSPAFDRIYQGRS